MKKMMIQTAALLAFTAMSATAVQAADAEYRCIALIAAAEEANGFRQVQETITASNTAGAEAQMAIRNPQAATVRCFPISMRSGN